MRKHLSRGFLATAATSVALLLATASQGAHAATTTVNLTAQRTSITLPDGATVPMWGYCSADAASAAAGNTALGGATLSGGACAAGTATQTWTPGPTITVPVGNSLTITLNNKLPTVTSIVILGQLSTDLGAPTKVTPPQHNAQTTTTWQPNTSSGIAPFTPPTQPARVESFGAETKPGLTGTYTWNKLKAGTYLYETGTHPSIQAPMGLYGVIVVTNAPVTAAGTTGNLAVPTVTAPGAAYPTVAAPTNIPYDADAVALLSEIDPVQNAAVDKVAASATGAVTINETIGCTSASPTMCYPAAVNYTPVYYLLNGRAFDRSNPATSVIGLPQSATTGALTGKVMLRFVNAGLRMHTPSVVGPTFAVIAEDGNPLPGNPRLQNEVVLPAGKTIDALFAPTMTTTAGVYDLKAYALFDRALGLSTNNKRDGGAQGFLTVLDANGGTAAAPTPYTALTTLNLATSAQAVADSYTLSLNSVTPLTGNVTANDIAIQSVALGTSTSKGALVLNTDGTFTYTPAAAFTVCAPTAPATTCQVDSFTYTGYGTSGQVANTVTVTISVEAGSTVTAANDAYNTPVSTTQAAVGTTAAVFRAGGNFGGVGLLANDSDSAGYTLTACPPAGCATAPNAADGGWTFKNAAGTLNVTLYPNGSFVASPVTPVTTATPTAYTFTYFAKNSQGIVSSSAATATVYFAAGSGLSLRLVDGITGKPLPAGTGIASLPDYRWLIEEDRTFHTPIGTALPAGTASLATSFFKSHMPVIAAGCTGPISCQMSGQSVGGTPVVADPTRYSSPAQVVLDPTKWYFVSILPGDSANPFIAANFADVKDCISGAQPATACGHTMGGASIRPGQIAATVPIQPSPLKPAQLSVYIYEDNAPTNGDPDEAELGLGGFEIIVVDVGGRTAGDPVGQITYDAFNMPLSNALLGQYGCPDTQNQHNDGNDYQVAGAGGPNNGHLTGVVYTCPQPPLNPDGSDPGTTGTHVVTAVSFAPPVTVGAGAAAVTTTTATITTADNHQLANGTSVTLACASAVAPCFQDASGNSIGALLGSFPITTTLDSYGTVTSGTSQTFTIVLNGAITGAVTVNANAGPTASDPNQYALRGQAVIRNLMPGRFDVIAHPGAKREAGGEKWYQVSTLEGTPGQDAFTKVNEPVYFQEFGPPGFHTQIGWVNPDHIAATNTQVSKGQVLSSIIGRITNLHMSRPVAETLYDSGSRTPLAHTNCLVDLNQNTGATQAVAFALCDDQGNFTLSNVPPADYNIVVWDTWLDQIITQKAVTVPATAQTIAVGDIPVFSWFTRVETSMFLDLDGTHKPSSANPTLSQSPVTIRYRDGSLVSIGLTDANGNAPFLELFPLFNWYVVEADTSRYKPTGVHVVVDAGGKADTTGEFAGLLNSNYLTAPAAYQALPTCTTSAALPVVTAQCKPAGVGPLGTERVDPGTDLFEGLQGFVSQTAILDFGRVQYAPTENGGITGHVVYASTRGFDDPRLLVQNLWEPLVPNVTINLYSKTLNADGTSSLKFAATTKTTSWDDFANATNAAGIQTNLQCPGQIPGVPAGTAPGTIPDGTDPYANYVLGWASAAAPGDQFRCYDGFHNWNQVQPAVYDGAYLFTTYTDATGKSTGQALPAGTYVVEMIPPPGYEVVKEEDKNILIGDAWTSPKTQQFATLANIFILPDQATLNNANLSNPCNGDPNVTNPNGCPNSNGLAGIGIQSNPTYDLGNTTRGDRFWPCVGALHTVPDYIAIFPASGQVSPFAGASKPLCDRKEVVLQNQAQVLADFYVFTQTPRAGHFTGLMLDDAAAEINAAAPDFGEKFALGFAPVSLRDFNGVEINRVYTDQWGTFNGLVPSTWQVNVPNPAGYSPNMLITCMNDPGPTPLIDPATLNYISQTVVNGVVTNTVVHDPALATMARDPQYNASYSDFCYTNPFMPGMTDYLDTPVLPIAAFASGYNPPDCAYNAGTPAVSRVDSNTNIGTFGGPYVNLGAAGTHTLTIQALGDVTVDNPLYQGPSAAGSATAIYKQKTITRHFGFGTYFATCSAAQKTAGTCKTASSVRLVDKGVGSYKLTVATWTDLGITANATYTNAAGNTVAVPAGDYELVITNGQNGLSSVDTVTVTVENASLASTTDHVWYVDPTYTSLASLGGACPNAAPRKLSTIQDALNCAYPGDLVLVNAGMYNELLVMWKPIRLQGVGAASVMIQATKFPTNKLEAWRPVINHLFGIDPNTGNFDPVTQVDLLPNQNSGAVVLLEPTILNTEEGAGITVLAKEYGKNGAPLQGADDPQTSTTPPPAGSCPVVSGAGAVNPFWDYSVHNPNPNLLLSNFRCFKSRIDGLSVTGGDSGGGIYVNGWAHGIEIANNRVFGNAGQYDGGIRVGSPLLEAQGAAPTGGYRYNLNVRIHHNSVSRNGTVEAVGAGVANSGGAGAGVSMAAGSDNYQVYNNWICGNYSSSDGGGFGHIGVSMNASIVGNTIIFNQSYAQGSNVHGGGIVIAGEPPSGGTLTNGAGNVLIDRNLILGNFAEAGHGGGVRLEAINGMDVLNNPTNTAGLIGADGSTLPTWYTVTMTNNKIVNNVAGWAGGGVSLSDALSVKIANNTIAYNDSTGIVGAVVITSLNGTTGQPAPAGIVSELTSPALAAVSGSPISSPTITNDIIVHNRSFFFDAKGANPTNGTTVPAMGQGVTQLCNSNAVADASATAVSHSCLTINPSTAAGQCQPNSNGTAIAYWDLGVLGDQAMTAPGALKLAPTTSVLTASNITPYAGHGNLGSTDAVLNLVKPYCNGPRTNPGIIFEPGQPFLPPFTMSTSATLDEAGNFVDLRYGPLSLGDPLAATAATAATLYGNYDFGTTSSALNSGADAGITNHDFYGTFRPQGSAFDIGAYEQVITGAGRGVSPLTLAFGDVLVGTTSAAQTVTVTNSGTIAFNAVTYAFGSARYSRPTGAAGGTCGATPFALAAGTSCTLKVVFSPTVVGSLNSTLTIGGFGNGLTNESVTLTGAGITGTVLVAPTTLAFGTVPSLTASNIETVTVTNTGSAAVVLDATNGLQVTSAVAANAAMYAIDQTSTCANGLVLQPAQSCTVALVFTPASVGAKPATLNVRFAVPPGTALTTMTAALTGTGAAAANAAVDPTAIAFGQVQIGQPTAAQVVTLSNVTAGNINVGNLNITSNAGNANQFAIAAGGTCATNLVIAAGGACTINVVMNPTAPAGLKTATLNVRYTPAGGRLTTVGVALSGVAQAQSLALSPTPLLIPPQAINVASPPQPITLTNTGVGPLTLRGIAITNGPPFAINGNVPGACAVGTPVPVGGTCTINVVVTPGAAAAYNAQVQVTYGPANTPAITDNVSVTGQAASATLLPQPNLNFGYQQVSTVAPEQVASIVNNGATPIQVASVTFLNGNTGDFSIDTTVTPSCVGVIQPGASCPVSIAFKPGATGTRGTTLQVTFASGVPATQTLPLTGIGIVPAATGLIDPVTGSTVSATTLAFGPQPLGTASAPKLVLLANAGTAAMPIGAIAFSGATPKDFSQTNTCGTVLIVGATCQIYVTYNPVTAVGASAATLGVTIPGVGSPITASASGTATAAPLATAAPATLTFPATQTGLGSTPLSVTLTSGSVTALSIGSISIAGPNAKDFGQVNTCGTGIGAAPANCSIAVTFTPSVAGAETATLTIVTSGGTQTVALSGTGQTPTASLSAPSALTSQVGAAGSPVSITFTNTGIGPETISGVAISGTNAADFTQTNTCVTSPTNPPIPAAGTCTITVTLKATVAGAETATLTVTDSAGQQSATLNGTGSSPAVSLAPTALTFANTQEKVASAPLTVTLTNTGIGPETFAATGSVTVTGANAADFAQTNTCAATTVAAGGTCTVTVIFTPTTAGAETATLTLVDTAGTQTVALTGTGVAPSLAFASGTTAITLPGPVAFANAQVGSAAAAVTLTATNNGIAPETISTVAVSGTNAADFTQTNTCTTAVLPVSGSCTVTLTFTPSAALAESAVVTITNSAGTAFAINLAGTGVAPTATLGPPSASPAAQSGSAATPFTLTFTNTGIGPETVASVVVSGANFGDFVQTNTCVAAPVPAGQSCLISVTFTATIVGAETATVTVTDTAGTQSQVLSGTGVAPSASVTPPVLPAFPVTAVGSVSGPVVVVIANNGIGPLTISAPALTAITGAAADFPYTTTCAAGVLPVGGSCSVSVSFQPSTGESSGAVDSATIVVGGAAPVSISVSGTVQ